MMADPSGAVPSTHASLTQFAASGRELRRQPPKHRLSRRRQDLIPHWLVAAASPIRVLRTTPSPRVGVVRAPTGRGRKRPRWRGPRTRVPASPLACRRLRRGEHEHAGHGVDVEHGRCSFVGVVRSDRSDHGHHVGEGLIADQQPCDEEPHHGKRRPLGGRLRGPVVPSASEIMRRLMARAFAPSEPRILAPHCPKDSTSCNAHGVAQLVDRPALRCRDGPREGHYWAGQTEMPISCLGTHIGRRPTGRRCDTQGVRACQCLWVRWHRHETDVNRLLDDAGW